MSDLIVAPSKTHGLGVLAAREYAPGSNVLVIDDRRVVDDQHPLQPELGEHEYHCDYLADGLVVLMQVPERYINSSCDPNTYVKTIDWQRHVIAKRMIYYGDEITYDYIINCHNGEVWDCNCGSQKCRKTIPSSFFELPIEDQIANLPYLDDWFISEHRKLVMNLVHLMSKLSAQV